MNRILSIRVPGELAEDLDTFAESTGRSRSEIVREALERELLLMRFEKLRREIMPYAEAQGFLTDEDVFRVVS